MDAFGTDLARSPEIACACSGCEVRLHPGDALDHRCEFCWVHCPPKVKGWAEGFAGIHRWRVHVLKTALESEGCDPMVFFPLIFALGNLPRAERWMKELEELDQAFERACDKED